MLKHKITYLLLILIGFSAEAKIDLPALFSDHMIIQRDKPIKIWGQCKYETSVLVNLNGVEKEAVIENGKFEVIFDAIQAGGPYILEVTGSSKITISDIYFGDVFILGGQSNMEWTTAQIKDASTELENADYPKIRFFNVPNTLSSKKSDMLGGSIWESSTKETAANFSGIGFLFGRNLYNKYEVPIGLIDNSWGGTDIKGWMPEEGFIGYTDYLEQIEIYKNAPNANVDIDAFMEEWIRNMDLKDLGNYGGWGFPSTNKSDWDETTLPGKWEYNGLPGYNGIMWYSRKFDADIQGNDTCLISLGKIDDEDLVYVNGMAIGSTQNYSAEREYTVPKSVLFESDNEIVVRVKDSGGDGGFWGRPDDLFCKCGENKFPLSGTWKTKQGTPDYPILPNEFGANAFPTNRYNAMVHPLTNFGIKGYLFYQGENDAGRYNQYSDLFSRMIRLYRSAWNDHQLPFMFVQLANFGRPSNEPTPESNWAGLRAAQATALSLPYTGMATAIDVGEANSIHPLDKQSVANRLTLIAQNLCYGEQVASSGPMFEEVVSEQSIIKVKFTNVNEGLKRGDYTKSIDGFTVLDQNGKWHNVRAKVHSSKAVSLNIDYLPLEVRYLWSNNPENVNLYNSSDLPALPFSWKKDN